MAQTLLDEAKNKEGPGNIRYTLSTPRWEGGSRIMFQVAHELEFHKNHSQKIEWIAEKLDGQPLTKSVLYNFIKDKTGFKGFENMSNIELVNLLHADQLNVYSTLFSLLNPVSAPNPSNVSDLVLSQVGHQGAHTYLNQSLYDNYTKKLHPHLDEASWVKYHGDKGSLIVFSPSYEDLQDIFTSLVEKYPNHAKNSYSL